MAMTKVQRLDRIEIERDGTVTVRRVTAILEDGTEIAQVPSGTRYSRTDSIAAEPAKVRTLIVAARDLTEP